MEGLDKQQKDWAIINAFRELLSIIKNRVNVSYADAIKFAKEIDRENLSNTQIGSKRKSQLEKLSDRYSQEALAKSRDLDKEVSREELMLERLYEIERLLKYYTDEDANPDGLRKEAADLESLLMQEKKGLLELQRVTESQAIMNDAYRRADKILINSELGKFNTYVDNENGNLFRVTILHPNPSEAIVGADLILEHYDEHEERVRIVAIQYKIWEDNILYFSKAGNLEDQLEKMKGCFCDRHYCEGETGENASADYRLPYCAGFLRPTDKLQDPNILNTSGYHLPICKIDKVKQPTKKSWAIRLEDIKNAALKAHTFEELFNANILGSRWLEIEDLERLYRRTRILEPTQKVVLYAQKVSVEKNKY
jgi:hypothetical protein